LAGIKKKWAGIKKKVELIISGLELKKKNGLELIFFIENKSF